MPHVTIDEGPDAGDAIPAVETSVTAFAGRTPLGPPDEPGCVTSLLEFERTFGAETPACPMTGAVRAYFENGGGAAVILKLVNRAGPDAPLDLAAFEGDGRTTGLHALRRDGFNLLCIPPDAPDTDTAGPVWAVALRICTACRAVLVIDAPIPPAGREGTPVAGLVRGVASLRAALGSATLHDAAVYFPRTIGGAPKNRPEAPCGAVAGVIARTDRARGVWKAPAGPVATIAGVQGLSVAVTERDAAQLGALGVNCLRSLPGPGPVVWGARTLAGPEAAGEFKYLSVRRLALFIETSIDCGTVWAERLPNTEPAWFRLRASVATFMSGLYRDGAFAGATPSAAFFVRCGRDTTTQADIAAGVLDIDVGFAPLKPAEFVIVRIRRRMLAP